MRCGSKKVYSKRSKKCVTKLPPMRKGSMGKYGYTDIKNLSLTERRNALKRAVKSEGSDTIIKRINLLSNYIKNTNPTLYKKIRADMNWIRKNYGSSSSRKTSKKSSKRRSSKRSKRRSSKRSKRRSSKRSKRRSSKRSKKSSKRYSRR